MTTEIPIPEAGVSPTPIEPDPAGSASRSRRRKGGPPPVFITGSILRHILVMTGAGALGLMAVFMGDLANIYFLSLLGDQAIVAAVGYASSIQFFSISIGIGLSIAATALVSPAIGAGRRARARRLSSNAHALTFIVSVVLTIALWLAARPMLAAIGASGRTLDLAWTYLAIQLPSLPLLAVGMTSAAVLRSVGDARRAMNITLAGAFLTVCFDVVLILYLNLGLVGAAFASAIARIGVMAVGLWGVIRVHDLISRPKLATMSRDGRAFAAIAVPAVLTNIATPAANAYVTYAMAAFGDAAVAGWAIIGRIIPVAFGAIYALSGTVGPIIGQNYGAGLGDRMRETLTQSIYTVAAFTLMAWGCLALIALPLADVFRAEGQARDLIVFFCRWLTPLFVFLGALFVANAVFNTLGKPHYSAVLNWLRATVGTVPFVMAGGALAGDRGVLIGNMTGGVVIGTLSVYLAYRLIADLGRRIAPLAPRATGEVA